MNSPSHSKILYESNFSIFNGRLCDICISSISHSNESITIKVTSSTDASILFQKSVNPNEFKKLSEALQEISNTRSRDPTMLGPRVESVPGNEEFPFRLSIEPSINESAELIILPLARPSPQDRIDHVLQLYAKEKALNQSQLAKYEALDKELRKTVTEYNTLKVRCEFQEKEINLLRQLTETTSQNRKRVRDDSINDTPTKKRRCGCGVDDGESCGSECDGEVDEDDEDDVADIEVFRAAAAKLQMSGLDTSQNIEVSSEAKNTIPSFMEQLEKNYSVIVKAPNAPSTSGIQIKMEEEKSGTLVLPGPNQSEDQNMKQKVVGVVQYVICQLCPEEEQKSMDLTNQKQMEEHFLDKHVDKEKKKCEACPSDQFQPHNIGQHYRLHTNSVYACQHCGKRGRRNYLMSHIRTHTGERPFRCDTCSKSFSDSSTLRRHRLVHTGEKKYQCPVCGRAIARKDNVKVHIRSHGIQI